MGIIRKQSFLNTGLSYLGVVVGFVNKAWLFTEYLETTEYGLIEALAAVALITMTFAQLGVGQIAIKFIPYFQHDKEKSSSFNFFLFVYASIGSLIAIALLWGGTSVIKGAYAENSALFNEYYLYIFPFFIAFTWSSTLQAISAAHLKTVFPKFLSEIFPRALHTVLIALFAWELVDFDMFLILYIGVYFMRMLALLIYLWWLGKLKMRLDFKFFKSKVVKVAINYGLFASLTGASAVLVSRLDIVMVGSLAAAGLDAVAPYALGIQFAAIVIIPARALGSISFPMIARAFKDRNFGYIESIYKKSSLNNFLVGSLVFIGIYVNMASYFQLRPKYESAGVVFLFISLSKLFDMIAGDNNSIINASKYYRFSLYINFLLVFLVILTNWLLIPLYGVVGAAIATVSSVVIYNLAKGIIIYKKFKMHPFSKKTPLIILIGGLAMFAGLWLPLPGALLSGNIYAQAAIDIAARSTVVMLVFMPLAYFLKISPEANDLGRIIFRKIGLMKK